MTLLVTLTVLYFLPTMIAIARHHRNTAAIVLLNLLLGWTVLGWIAAMIWAHTNPTVMMTIAVKTPAERQTITATEDPARMITRHEANTEAEVARLLAMKTTPPCSSMTGEMIEEADMEERRQGPDGEEIRCPWCQEWIIIEALVCRHCRREVRTQKPGPRETTANPRGSFRCGGGAGGHDVTP